MRIKHIEIATTGLSNAIWGRKEAAMLPDMAARIRWLTWHGKLTEALSAIKTLTHASGRLEDASRPEIGVSIRKITARDLLPIESANLG